MPAEWYCRIAGEDFGPLTAAQMRALAAEGRLSPGDAVRQGKSGVWVPAGSVKGLLDHPTDTPHPPVSPPPLTAPPPPITEHLSRQDMASGRSRPLLRAQPMEDEPAETPAAPPLAPTRKLSDVGIDLGAAQPATPSSASAKGWRSTGLDFLAEEQPIAPDGPKAAPSPPGSRPKDPAAPLRRWLLPSLVGVFALLLIVLFVVGRMQKGSTSGEPSGHAAAAKGPGGTRPAPGKPTGAGSKGPAPPGKASTVPPRDPSAPLWIDASRGPWTHGDVTVKIRSASIARARVVDVAKRIAESQDEYLLIAIELTNHSKTRKIEYTSWSLRGERPQLADDLGNKYLLQAAPAGGLFEGQQRNKSLYPEKSLEDLLVCEPPVPRAKWLRLQLPAGAFEEQGTGQFEIPMSMVRSEPPGGAKPAPQPSPAGEKAPPPKSGSAEEPKAKTGAGTRGKPWSPAPKEEGPAPKRSGSPESDFGIKAEEVAPSEPASAPPPPNPASPSPAKGPPPAPPIQKR